MSDPRLRLMERLVAPGPPGQRLDSALVGLAEDLDLDHCHLYLREDAETPFRLVHSWARTHGTTAAHTKLTSISKESESTAEASAALELRTVPGEDFTEVRTPLGPLVPLRLEIPGRIDGVLLLRPRRRLGSSGRGVLVALRNVLCGVIYALRREDALERELAVLATREQTTSQLRNSAFSLEHFLDLLLDMSVRSTLAEGGFVAVADRVGRLSIRVTSGLVLAIRAEDLDPETGLFDWSMASETGALLLRDPERAQQLGIRSILAVPLLRAHAPLGVVALTTVSRAAAFTEHNLDLLGSFAEQVSLMLENQRLSEDFSEQYLGVLEGIARSLDQRRPETAGYHSRVARLATAVATELTLDRDEVLAIRRAGLVHDVGLAGIPAAGHAFLADVEHPAIAAQLVDALPLHPSLAAAVACHHEWYDGWGMPRGLQGRDIPLAGRVLALAAFAGEMSCGGLAREPWEPERIMAELSQRRGSQFDPEVVEAALAVLPRELAEASDRFEENQ